MHWKAGAIMIALTKGSLLKVAMLDPQADFFDNWLLEVVDFADAGGLLITRHHNLDLESQQTFLFKRIDADTWKYMPDGAGQPHNLKVRFLTVTRTGREKTARERAK